MTKKKQDFETWTGNDENIEVAVVDEDEAVVNIAAATITWIAKATRNSIATLIIKDNDANGGITITDGAGGIFRIDIDPSDTENLESTKYYHEAKTVIAGDIKTVLEGTMFVNTSGFSDLP